MQEAPILATQIDTHEEHTPSFGFRGHLQASGRHLRHSVGPLHVVGRASAFHIYSADLCTALLPCITLMHACMVSQCVSALQSTSKGTCLGCPFNPSSTSHADSNPLLPLHAAPAESTGVTAMTHALPAAVTDWPIISDPHTVAILSDIPRVQSRSLFAMSPDIGAPEPAAYDLSDASASVPAPATTSGDEPTTHPDAAAGLSSGCKRLCLGVLWACMSKPVAVVAFVRF